MSDTNYDRKAWVKRKPFCKQPGYVASLKARMGGWVVIYDSKLAPQARAVARWVVRHEPSGGQVCEVSEARARLAMKGLAKARCTEDADAIAYGVMP